LKLPKNIFFFDVELAKNLYAKFGSKRPEFLGHKDIISHWWMICWAGQWSDSKKVIGASVLDNKTRYNKEPTDDYHVIKTLYDQIKVADAIVGHNMAKFDWKKFMAQVTYYKMKPLQQPLILDTMNMAKAIGAYESNSLGFLCERHGLPNKVSNRGNDLWNDIAVYALRRDYKKLTPCIKEMVHYCGPDVTAVKALYEFLAPYAPSRFILNQNLHRLDNGCPFCASDNLTISKHRITAAGKTVQYQCQDCGRYCSNNKNVKKVGFK